MNFKTRRLKITRDHLVVHSNEGPNSLVISTSVPASGDVSVAVRPYDDSEGRMTGGMDIDAVFGIFKLYSGPYLAVVTKSHMVGQGQGQARFYRVDKVSLVPFNTPSKTAEWAKDEKWLLGMLNQLFQTRTFYFAENYDITLRLQEIVAASKDLEPWQRADRRFFWNAHLLQPLMAANAHEFIVPMMNGMVKTLPSLTVGGKEFDLVFISRRSCHNVGTRFNVRGLDSHGNAANFAETEQILLHADGSVSSLVQVRGSIPLYWTQYVDMKYMPEALISDNEAASHAAFSRHVEQLAVYGSTLCVNLVDKKPGMQKRLGEAFDKVVQRYNKPAAIQVEWFDFHHECRKMQWHNLSKLVDRVRDKFDDFGYFHMAANGTIEKEQRGVFRTNCMDNLDRTNVVQSLFARRFTMTATGKLAEQRDVLASPYSSFERSFKNLWADHANVISRLYSGTGALKTDFTRTGKRTKRGLLQDGWRSVKRYFINNLADGNNQDAWDFFLGKYVADPADRSALRKSRTGPTIPSFLKQLALLFVVLMALFATFLAPSDYEWSGRVKLGFAFATVVFGLLSWLQLKKGVGLGKMLTNPPSLVPLADPKSGKAR